MLPILLVLGATGALLEFKRLVDRPPKEGDLYRLQKSEEHLKRVLQVSLIHLTHKKAVTFYRESGCLLRTYALCRYNTW